MRNEKGKERKGKGTGSGIKEGAETSSAKKHDFILAHHHNSELVDQIITLFRIDLDKPRLHVLLRQLLEVSVDVEAVPSRGTVEVNDEIVRGLGGMEELLCVRELHVPTVALSLPVKFLPLLSLQSLQSLLG